MQELNLGEWAQSPGNSVNCDGKLTEMNGGQDVYTMTFDDDYHERLALLAKDKQKQQFNGEPSSTRCGGLVAASGLRSLVSTC